MPDLYRLLKVRRTAAPEEITAAYRRLAMQFHPDRNPGDPAAAERFKRIQDAYAVLSDPERRKRYDETGDAAGPARPPDHIADTLGSLLALIVRSGFNGGQNEPRIQDVDLVAEMRKAIARAQADVRQAVLPFHAELAAWKALVGRFTVPAGAENYPEGIARSHMRRLEDQVAGMEAEVTKLGEVAEYLKTVKYRVDNPFCGIMDAYAPQRLDAPPAVRQVVSG